MIRTIFLTSLFPFLTPQVPALAGPGGKLTVLLKTFSNPSSKDLNGDCCESSCRGCDYFLQICLKQTSGASCVASATTNIYYNTKYVVFKKDEGFSSGGKNPLIWHFSLWTVLKTCIEMVKKQVSRVDMPFNFLKIFYFSSANKSVFECF